MNLQVNGIQTEINTPISLLDLLALHKLKPETVAVEYNLRVPSKTEYASIQLQDGDRIEIVKFMGGG